jgi:trehalose 6-phosphate synthase/phosphatase
VPEAATPDDALLELLAALARRPGTSVHVTSGRTRQTLERWLRALPVALHAEHGLWSRDRPSDAWQALAQPDSSWMESVLPILERLTAATAGSHIEVKSAALAWHYRTSDPVFGLSQARELRVHLTETLANRPVEVIAGNKVVEVRQAGVSKGKSLAAALARMGPSQGLVVAFGDDRTDEDMFAALPKGGIAVHVGPGQSRAAYRLEDVEAVRQILAGLIAH